MKTLACTSVRQLFNVVQMYEPIQEINGTHYNAVQMHVDCGMVFAARWEYRVIMNHVVDEGLAFRCPRCGKLMINHYVDHDAGDGIYCTHREEVIPLQMDITVKEYKDYVDLDIRYKACETLAPGVLLRIAPMTRLCRCLIRADIKKQEIRIRQRLPNGKDTEMVADPLAHPEWPGETPLCYLCNSSNVRKYLTELRGAIRSWRQAIEAKLGKKLGYHVPSMYVETRLSDSYGAFHRVLQNVAWRLAAPTAPKYDRDEWQGVLSKLEAHDSRLEDWQLVLSRTRAGQEYYSAVCASFGLPNKHSLRKQLQDDGLFAAYPSYTLAHEVTGDVNLIVELGHLLHSEYRWGDDREQLTAFARILAARYDTDAAVRFLRANRTDILDTAHMYDELTRENRKALWALPRIQHRELHDAVQQLYNRQKTAYRVIAHRLQDKLLARRVGPYDFYLPGDSYDLCDISSALHNCVKSYTNKAAKHECTIVAVRRDKHILVCIEIRDGSIVQAKRDQRNGLGNSGVCKDAALNGIVVQWARLCHLKIGTKDINQESSGAYGQAAV